MRAMDLVKMAREIAALDGTPGRYNATRDILAPIDWEGGLERAKMRGLPPAVDGCNCGVCQRTRAQEQNEQQRPRPDLSGVTEEMAGEPILPLYSTTTVRIPLQDIDWRGDKRQFEFISDKLAEGGIRMVYPCDKFEDFCLWWDDYATQERVYQQTILVLPNGDEYVQARSKTAKKAAGRVRF